MFGLTFWRLTISPSIFKARLHFGDDRSKLVHFTAQKIVFF